ncbi:HlyD family type I secretion periplasmic adaptor subunit [Ensifer sp. ENS03]|nr:MULTISPECIES: HlyD family type I secretion periplasmic adaptor subunit [Ensifer]KSV62373.1 hypothetical protein N185_08150 [Sinorhizobium sp. GW3]MBD9559532.1 HlyD family type I secretion periplasmic adaptor subunit [Ensifer sp. ENS03]MBD9625367.1 HlyD family type I secretion periplasmic adaptor subunit [Ensifer sp. ENS06]MBW0365509.1 HlyD family type I secretion periplasmic adaptor subunit [Ensifer adhaerens]
MTAATTRRSWRETIVTDTGLVARLGYGTLVLILAGFGYWAATAPLSGAAVASGTITATGRNVLVQHLEGGIVSEIAVREGDAVARGQTLVVLDDTVARTQLNRLAKQWVALKAREARLAAERDGRRDLTIAIGNAPATMSAASRDLTEEQVKEFQTRLARFTSETVILQQRVESINDALDGLAAQKAAVEKQTQIVRSEAERKFNLLEKGLTNRTEYTQLLRVEADLLGQVGMLQAESSSSRTQVAEAREQIERLKTQRVEQAVTAMNEVKTGLADVEEQVEAARRVLERTVVKAPVDGVVVASVYNAVGSVVGPGEKIMEILPTGDLVVDARIHPQDIDVVHVGQPARVRLSALNTSLTPEVSATVAHVSADRLTDPATREPYYRAVLRLDTPLPPGVRMEQLHPGMPIDAFIELGDRTFLEYLIRPISDSYRRAFAGE